ncbi:amidohydrolase family protein [bacterium]|nr:amidohydrolase family protein [bacterium]
MSQYTLISADSHVVESPDLWTKWLQPEFLDRAPKLVKDASGGDAWQYRPGTPPVPLGLVTTYPGRTYEAFKWEGARYDTVNAGAWNGAVRLKEQQVDGVDAEVLYPSQRTMRHYMLDDDDVFHKAGIQAYNNWMAKEFMAADPKRLIGLAQIPNLGVEEAIAEMRRAKEMGMRGVILSSWPAGAPTISKEDDAFWAEAVKLGMPCSIHLGTVSKATSKGSTTTTGKFEPTGLLTAGQKTVATYSTAGMDSMPPIIAETIMSGLFDRFPSLVFVSVEAGAGWVPFLLEQMDDRWWRNRHWAKVELEMLPSEYFKRNWRLTFVQDFYGIRNRHDVGVDNMMWSTDYPHHICDWPYSRKIANEMFAGVPDEERWKICVGNAAKVYGLL